MIWVWKLKGFLKPAEGGLALLLLLLLSDAYVSKVSKAGVAGLPILPVSDFMGEAMDPKRAEGEKVSVLGDRAFGSHDTVEYTVRPAPLIPNPSGPSGSSGMGVGGVGVRGGAGIGRLEAIVADYRSLRSMGRFEDR
jgi:hypothetical protein